ncbi:MAG: FAD-dependent oxidoreductase, partial [Pseudomonadota bacterium]
MFFDARTVSEADVIETDLCIVGGGAAGVSLAMELIGSGLKVVLLESGDMGYDDRIQSLYKGPNIGFWAEPLDEARLRMFGGSTNHWAGNCMRLDPIDFEAREGIPHSGWPITYDDVEPFYLRAQRYVETPAGDEYDTPARREAIGKPFLPFDPDRIRSVLYAESPPTAFGFVYEDQLRAAEDIAVYLFASVLEVETDGTASEVTGLRVSSIDGPEFRVRARHYVLAAGGIEIPRIMLLSNAVATNGIGNENDLVGRFFMDHMSLRPSLTAMIPRESVDLSAYTEAHFQDDGYFRTAVVASEKILREEKLPNFRFILFENTERSPGSRSAERLFRDIRDGEATPN